MPPADSLGASAHPLVRRVTRAELESGRFTHTVFQRERSRADVAATIASALPRAAAEDLTADVLRVAQNALCRTAANLSFLDPDVSAIVSRVLVVPRFPSQRHFSYVMTRDGTLLRVSLSFHEDGSIDLVQFFEHVEEWREDRDRVQNLVTASELRALRARTLPHRFAPLRLAALATWHYARAAVPHAPSDAVILRRVLDGLMKQVLAPLFDEIVAAERGLIEQFLDPSLALLPALPPRADIPTIERLQHLRNRLQAKRDFPIVTVLLRQDAAEIVQAEPAPPEALPNRPNDELRRRAEPLLAAIDAGDSVLESLATFIGMHPWMARTLRGKQPVLLGGYEDQLSRLGSDLALFSPATAPRTQDEFHALYELMHTRRDLQTFREMLTRPLEGRDLQAFRALLADELRATELGDYERFLHQVRRWVAIRLPDAQFGPLLELVGTRSVADWVGMCAQWHRTHLHFENTLSDLLREPRRRTVSPNWPVPFADDIAFGGYTFHVLKNARELAQEGLAMSHCVGTYADVCRGGESAILSMRYEGRRVVSIELNMTDGPNDQIHFELEQASGRRNARPSAPQRDAIAEFVAAANKAEVALLPYPRRQIVEEAIKLRHSQPAAERHRPPFEMAVELLGPQAVEGYRTCLEPRPGASRLYELCLQASQRR